MVRRAHTPRERWGEGRCWAVHSAGWSGPAFLGVESDSAHDCVWSHGGGGESTPGLRPAHFQARRRRFGGEITAIFGSGVPLGFFEAAVGGGARHAHIATACRRDVIASDCVHAYCVLVGRRVGPTNTLREEGLLWSEGVGTDQYTKGGGAALVGRGVGPTNTLREEGLLWSEGMHAHGCTSEWRRPTEIL